MNERIERMIESLTAKVDEVGRAVALHDTRSSGYVDSIREDSARIADVLDRAVSVLTQLEARMSLNGNGKHVPAQKALLSEGTLKLALAVALAVALGGLGRDGLLAFMQALGWVK